MQKVKIDVYPINSKNVFETLLKLNKKIISITPKTHSAAYLDRFNFVIRVLNVKGETKIALISKDTKYSDVAKMFEVVSPTLPTYLNYFKKCPCK